MQALSKGKTALADWLIKILGLLYRKAKKEVRQINGRPPRLSPLEFIHSLA